MASAIYRLAFEQPIHALEQRIAELEVDRNEVARAARPDSRAPPRARRHHAPHLQPARPVGDGAGRPPSRSADVHRLPRPRVRRVRRAARRQVLRRRPRAAHRLRQARSLQGAGRRPSQRQDPQRTQRVLLRLRPSRRLSQGDGQDAAGRQVQPADHLPDRHARRVSRASAPKSAARPRSSPRACSKCRGSRRRSSAS